MININNKHKNKYDKETYTQIKILGEGSFGKAYLVRSNLDNKEYVWKNIDLSKFDEKYKKYALDEISVLKNCKHPNIILFKEAFIIKKPFISLNLILEFADNGDIQEQLRQRKEKHEHFQEDQIINWLIQICLALKYIHNLHVIHRDIKPSNIFLTKKGIIKLGDFGISKVLSSKQINTNTFIGTPLFLSPEIINAEKYDYTADIWSLGVTFFELIYFALPFKGKSELGLYNNIINGIKNMSINESNEKISYSKELIDIVNKMLSKNPKDRPNINEIFEVSIIKKYLKIFLEEHKSLYKDIELSDKRKDVKVRSVDDINQKNEKLLTIISENQDEKENFKDSNAFKTSNFFNSEFNK